MMAIPLQPVSKPPSPPPQLNRVPCAVRAFLLIPVYPTETELLHMRAEYKRYLQSLPLTSTPTSTPTSTSNANPSDLPSLIFTEQNFYIFFHRLSHYIAHIQRYLSSGGRLEPVAATMEKVFDAGKLVADFLERRKGLLVEEWESGLKLKNREVKRERVEKVFARSERWDLLSFKDPREVDKRGFGRHGRLKNEDRIVERE